LLRGRIESARIVYEYGERSRRAPPARFGFIRRWTRCLPFASKLQAVLASGAIGEVRAVQSAMCFDTGEVDKNLSLLAVDDQRFLAQDVLAGRQRGVDVGVEATWTRCLPFASKLQAVLASGAIGEVRAVQSAMCQEPEPACC
jgi:predicted dehydrogenase